MRVLYSALLYCLLPLALARLLWRSRREPGYRARLGERLGYMPAMAAERPLWLHAVSVGEVSAALPLLDALLARYPGVPLVISTTTPSGAELLRARCGERVRHVYLPFDTPGAVRRAFTRLGPRALVLLETELWPNLVALAPCPVLLLNARLSQRSARRYARVPGLTTPMLRSLAHIACQSGDDAERFVTLGAPAANVSVCGNLKADRTPCTDHARTARWLPGGGRVLLAGSTHEGEEAALLAAFAALRSEHTDLRLLIAPRHVTRVEKVLALCREAGWRVARGSAEPAPVDVLVLDILGELAGAYALADVAFVGGSLSARGGHNLLEPAAHGTPVVTGPSLYNFAALAQALEEAGALRIVSSEAGLVGTLRELLGSAATRAAMGEAGRSVAAQSRGALAHCLERIERVLVA